MSVKRHWPGDIGLILMALACVITVPVSTRVLRGEEIFAPAQHFLITGDQDVDLLTLTL